MSDPLKPGRRVLRIQRVMALYGVSRRTVYYWMVTGKVDWAQVFGGRVIYVDSLPLYDDMVATRAAEGHEPPKIGVN